MKRDMDLVRELLLYLERSSKESTRKRVAVDGHSREETNYHLLLLLDAGLIEGRRIKSFQGNAVLVERMTWAGHDFLEAIRPPGVWHRVQKKIAPLGGATFDIVKKLATEAALERLS